MKIWQKVFLIEVIFATVVVLTLKSWYTEEHTQVLSLTTLGPTSTPIQTFTPTPTPTEIVTPKPTKSATPASVPQPQFSQEQIEGFMTRFALQYGVDVNVLRHIAVCESGFNTNASNGPYAGLYQFGKTAWKSNRALMGEEVDFNLRFDAEEATQTAAFIISKGKTYLWPNCYPK